MPQSWNVTKAAVFCLAAGLAWAQTASLTVNTGNILHTVDPKIYGQFLQHDGHSVYGGLWGDVVWNGSFEETVTEGVWRVSREVLEAAGGYGDSRFRLGAESWLDYDLSVDLMRPSGNGVVSVAVRSNRDGHFAVSLRGASGFDLEGTAINPQTMRPEPTVLQTAAGQIENGRWYRVRIKIEGPRLQVWLDGRVLFDFPTADYPANGQAYLTVSGGTASFAHLSVKSTDGAPLFAGVPTPAPHWYAAGGGETALNTDLPLNGKQSLRIVAHDADSGIEQPDYAVRAGDALRGSLWLKGTGPGLVVRLLDGGKVLAEQPVGAPGAEWQEFPLLLNPTAASGNATLRILAHAGSVVRLDQVSLMPDSYRANGGFRPDLTQAVAALHPSIIRWKGGTLGEDYKWNEGIGPQAKRVGKNGWTEWDPHSFGIDEFLAFARKVGAEPVVVVPIGRRNQLDRALYLQNVLDLVAYCNGPRDSAWGKVRARNGHADPYRVKYWEVGDETLDPVATDYVEAIRQFIPAMKKVDPAIRTIATDSGGRWLAVIRDAAQLVDYLSFIQSDDPEGPAAAAQFWKEPEEEIARSKNPRLKFSVSYGNAQNTHWRAGLYTAGFLNAIERDVTAGMATPLPFMRHVTTPAGDKALINFDQRSWFPSPDYVVMKLYRDHFAPDLLEVSGDLGGLSGTATRTPDGETIYLKLVNPADREVAVEVALRGDFPLLAASMQLVAPDSLDARNTLDQPTAVQAIEGKVERTGMSARLRLPRWSVAVVTLSR
jgi:alpha-N-arabinofuranosidase